MLILSKPLYLFRPRAWSAVALACLLVVSPARALPSPEAAPAFGQRMAAVVEAHPDVIAAKRQLDAAVLGIDAARAGYYPRISLDSNLGRENAVTGNDGETAGLSRRAADVVLRQNIYTGGRLGARVDAAQIEQSQLRVSLRQVRQKIALDALTAHLQVSRSALLQALAAASEQATQNLQDVERRRLGIGGGTRSDVDFASTRLALARERTQQYSVQLDEALTAYRALFDEIPDPVALADLSLLPQRLPAQLEAAVAQALERHPDLRAAELAIERARTTLAVEQSQNLPTVELVATRHLDSVPASQALGRTDSTVGLRVSYSAFSGGETKARVGAAAARLSALTESIVTARRNVDSNVRLFHRRLSGTASRIETLQQAADDAQSVFINRARLRELGRETAVAVLDAQLEYNNVLISLVNAVFDSRLNAIRLANALGALAEEEGVANWFADFVDPARPLDRLRERIRQASLIGSAASRPSPRTPLPTEPVPPPAAPVGQGTPPAPSPALRYELRLTLSLPGAAAAQPKDDLAVQARVAAR